jgi:hypothetical protein
MIKSICFVLLAMPLHGYSQELNTDEMMESTKNDFLIVVSAGLGGAILGLSTLSFVEEPKEHTRNILVGASVGIIAGVAIVAYLQAEKSSSMFYGDEAQASLNTGDFNTYARAQWHTESHTSQLNLQPEAVNWTVNF